MLGASEALHAAIGATNRPEVLDPALRRPGRFDREILVDRPHRDGRLAILKVHAKKLTLAPDVDLGAIASRTTGFVGADLANLCNEAALLASRKGRDAVAMQDFEEAFERVIGGLEKKGKVMNERERRTVAYHESGHTLVGYFTAGADPVQNFFLERYAAAYRNEIEAFIEALVTGKKPKPDGTDGLKAQMMADAVRAKGLPVAYLAFEGEQHGFRKAETNIRCLEAELYFYGVVFGFAPADTLPAIVIENR